MLKCEAWCLNSSILLCPLNLDLLINVFFSFIFLFKKFGKIGHSLYPNLQLVWK
jgi:hypothetical protein